VAEGEVTWLQDGQLRAAVNGGQPTCLVEGVDGSVAWSSDAARVLIGSTTAISASGSRQTGFDSSNGTVILSAPTGTATIGIDPATHRLIRHGSDGAVSDISFLARTDEAIYHPGGKRIVAVGTSDSGEYGIWLSTNVGTEPKQILSVDDPTTPVTNVSFSADGTTLYFIHGFVHQLLVSNGLILNEIGQADRQEANLVVSKISNDEAWTIGPCDASGSVLMASPALREPIDIRTVAGSPFADSSMTLVPVGWLTDSRLVFAARTSGCDGPADIWVWAVGDTFRQVAHDASSASVRIPRGPFMDLPEVIEQAAPG
jgi:hypothetical protein